jgi:hypothetical protein
MWRMTDDVVIHDVTCCLHEDDVVAGTASARPYLQVQPEFGQRPFVLQIT